MKKKIKKLRYLLILVIPLFAGCGSSDYSVSGGYTTAKDIFNETYNSIRPFIIALATCAIGYNAIIMMIGPIGDNQIGDLAAVARRRIIIVVCAVIAFMLLHTVVNINIPNIIGE